MQRVMMTYIMIHLPGGLMLQDAEKNRAVEESEAAAAMQREVAAKYCTSLDALQVWQQYSAGPLHQPQMTCQWE
jgi:hypothetical protein